MGLLEHLRRQFAYDAWANREVLAALSASAHSNERARQLLAHILSAQRLWLERIRKRTQSQPVWPDFSLDQCEAQISELASLLERVPPPSFFLSSFGECLLQKQQGRVVE